MRAQQWAWSMLPKEGGFKGLRVQYQRDAFGRGVRTTLTHTLARTHTNQPKMG